MPSIFRTRSTRRAGEPDCPDLTPFCVDDATSELIGTELVSDAFRDFARADFRNFVSGSRTARLAADVQAASLQVVASGTIFLTESTLPRSTQEGLLSAIRDFFQQNPGWE